MTLVPCGGYASGGPYDLVKGDVYTVLPFGNNIVTRDVTGLQVWQMLENGVSLCPTHTRSRTHTQHLRGPIPAGVRPQGDVQAGATRPGAPAARRSNPPTWACTTGTTHRTQTVTTLRRDADPGRRYDLHLGHDRLHEHRR